MRMDWPHAFVYTPSIQYTVYTYNRTYIAGTCGDIYLCLNIPHRIQTYTHTHTCTHTTHTQTHTPHTHTHTCTHTHAHTRTRTRVSSMKGYTHARLVFVPEFFQPNGAEIFSRGTCKKMKRAKELDLYIDHDTFPQLVIFGKRVPRGSRADTLRGNFFLAVTKIGSTHACTPLDSPRGPVQNENNFSQPPPQCGQPCPGGTVVQCPSVHAINDIDNLINSKKLYCSV